MDLVDVIVVGENRDENGGERGEQAAQHGDERHADEVQGEGDKMEEVDTGGDRRGEDGEQEGEREGNGLTRPLPRPAGVARGAAA